MAGTGGITAVGCSVMVMAETIGSIVFIAVDGAGCCVVMAAETPGSCVGVAVIVAVRAVVFVLITAETPGVAVLIAADSAGSCVVIQDKTTGNPVLTGPVVAMFVVLIATGAVGFVVATGAVLFTITVVAEPETAANGVIIAAGSEVLTVVCPGIIASLVLEVVENKLLVHSKQILVFAPIEFVCVLGCESGEIRHNDAGAIVTGVGVV